MEDYDESAPHKSVGNGGSFQASPSVFPTYEGETRSSEFRQHDSVLLSEQTGGGGARSGSLFQKAESLLLWCDSLSISRTARFVPGKLNVLADVLDSSNMVLQSDWTIALEVLKPV